ncbi:MAG: Gfo/Idh/MocA family oxidoreductase [Gemmatimonadetes bacterium]|nr:Gfo/Idh/MocA family oxidoreductase [Gemmatimonadota bacterium]MDA1103287.1 Gfo/Idh/MocA family oxidoreductase [Gemmatimonadota bacterium]
MVGGGPGAFIGAVHRMAAVLDGRFQLVAGAFSSDPAKSAEMGRELGIDPGRAYASYLEMVDREAARPKAERIQVVVIVTPNHLHYPVALSFMEAGFHIVCDKPLTTSVADAESLCRLAEERGLVFAVTHNYTGYPMVKEARERIRDGELGALRKVVVEYSQGWLSTLLEAEGQKQAEWRADPERGGASAVLGDIGSHAHSLVRYVTGLEVQRLFADLGTVVEGRHVDDDATVLLELDGGVRGVLLASQISTGERNHLRLRVYGRDGGLDWCQEDPERLRILSPDGSERILFRGAGTRSGAALGATRIPAGHPEGFIEAFANLYRSVAAAVRGRESGARTGSGAGDESSDAGFPTVRDGARGVHFIHRALESNRQGGWVDAAYTPPGSS